MHAAGCQTYRQTSWDAAIAQAGTTERPQRAQRHRGHDTDDGTAHTHRWERRHPLMTALKDTLSSLAPDASTRTDGDDERRNSVHAFAHELTAALRGLDDSQHGHGYGQLAQRLDRLADTLSQTSSKNAAAPAESSSVSASLSATSLSVTVDENGGVNASLSVTSLSINVSQPRIATASGADDSPLLAAFRRLMSALQPQATPTNGVGESAGNESTTDDVTKLTAFLRQLAAALRGASPEDDSATTGSLVSLAA